MSEILRLTMSSKLCKEHITVNLIQAQPLALKMIGD
jgi:hypothetical protein